MYICELAQCSLEMFLKIWLHNLHKMSCHLEVGKVIFKHLMYLRKYFSPKSGGISCAHVISYAYDIYSRFSGAPPPPCHPTIVMSPLFLWSRWWKGDDADEARDM